MALIQNPIFLVVIIIILIGILVGYRLMRSRKKQPNTSVKTVVKTESAVTTSAAAATAAPALTPARIVDEVVPPPAVVENRVVDLMAGTSDQMDQIINPDVNLIPDVILKPSEETVLIILPERVPVEEVKKFETFLRGIDALKIVTTGGSSDEGSNFGIRVLSTVNLTELLNNSNMSIVKHLRKKGERVVISCKNV